MSWIRRRPLLALGALALALRVSCAVWTEYAPLFAAYYYTDARLYHETASSALRDEAQGRRPVFVGVHRIQTRLVYELYRWTGPRPLAPKLVNAVLGTAGVLILVWMFGFVVAKRAAFASGCLVAAWPSHVFYTSQNFKEAPANLLAYAGLACALAAGLPSNAPGARRGALAAGSVLTMIGAGLYRPQVLAALSASVLVVLALAALGRRDEGRGLRRVSALAALGALAATLMLFTWTARRIAAGTEYQLVPEAWYGHHRPTSPSGITAFRKTQQRVDRGNALAWSNRQISTQIFPDVEFRTWGDVLCYLPKGALYALFMPLPGLYPMDGKIGRLAASGENLILLLIAALAAVGIVRGPKTPARLGLLAFFTMMMLGAALLEFDLGGAVRHKLLYLPMLFPFAVEATLCWFGFSGPAVRR